MNALAKITEAQPLSDQQSRFVQLVLSGMDPDEAKVKAGYSATTPTSQLLRGRAVENAIRAGCDAELAGPLRVQAMLRLKKLITDDKTPSATAFNAAKLIIERGDDKPNGEDKPLSEMTPGELEALIDRLQREREAAVINVTPTNGALS